MFAVGSVVLPGYLNEENLGAALLLADQSLDIFSFSAPHRERLQGNSMKDFKRSPACNESTWADFIT